MKRTVQLILNRITGEQLEADYLLRNPKEREADIFRLRGEIENALQAGQPIYVCNFCKQAVALPGIYIPSEQTKDFYFRHVHDSGDCLYKVASLYTEEEILCIKFNGAKEGELHIRLKNEIAERLRTTPGVTHVDVEKVYRDKAVSKDWKKPDVLAKFEDKTIAFELQLATTFLSVIVARTRFYKERNVFLLWVFDKFSVDQDVQKFTQKDVYYNNNINVYVFDAEARKRSQEAEQLLLKCYYKAAYLEGKVILYRWESTIISIADIKFDPVYHTFYYYDSEAERRQLQQQIWQQEAEEQRKQEHLLARAKIDRVVNYLRQCYKYNEGLVEEDGCLDEIQTATEIELLNEELGFRDRKPDFITSLFVKGDKPNFLELICEQDMIWVDTARLIVDGKTMLQYLLTLDLRQFYPKSSLLFRKGYTLTESDFAVLDGLFEKNRANSTDEEIEQISRWAFVKGLNGIWYKQDALKLTEVRKLLFAVLSLQYGLTIGLKYQNLRQLSHYILQDNPEYGLYYIKAMKHFGQYDAQLRDDKSGKLKEKLKSFLSHPHEQTTHYNFLLDQIFPDLAHYSVQQ